MSVGLITTAILGNLDELLMGEFMSDNPDLEKQLKKLVKRVSSLEEQLNRQSSDAYDGREKSSGRGRKRLVISDSGKHLARCKMPLVPPRTFDPSVSEDRARLILRNTKKWVNGTNLRYFFFRDGDWGGSETQYETVREAFETWADVGIGLNFQEVNKIEDAEIRIGFERGDGAWSYVGRDVIDIPGQMERTMNFGWDIRDDLDTALHEIGHTLGFPHEHQNPYAGIVWDEEAVYRDLAGAPNFWSRETTFHNILKKLSPSDVQGSDWDPDSIMHYPFQPGMIISPEEYNRNGIDPEPGLSSTDENEVRKFYPPLDDGRNQDLKPYESERLSLKPGEQRNFNIKPSSSRSYTIQTFGESDVVMVLFELIDGTPVYVAGDDDSGTSLNARIEQWLNEGKNYVLRIRLFSNYASGNTAVLLW